MYAAITSYRVYGGRFRPHQHRMQQQIFDQCKTSVKCRSESAWSKRSAANEHSLVSSASLVHRAHGRGFESAACPCATPASTDRARADSTNSASRSNHHHTGRHSRFGPDD